MIIQASTTQIASTGSTKINSFTISGTKENQHGTSAMSSQSDSLVISTKGMALFAENQKLASSAIDAINNNATNTTSTTEDDDDDATTTSDLSGYSDSQLKQLAADGTISQAEATAEIAKRENSKTTEQNNLTTTSYSDTHIDALV